MRVPLVFSPAHFEGFAWRAEALGAQDTVTNVLTRARRERRAKEQAVR